MLANISWTDYLVATALMVTLYYLYVLIRYYPKEIKGMLSGKQRTEFWSENLAVDDEPATDAPETILASSIGFTDTNDDFFESVEQLLARAKGRIADASGRGLSELEFKLHIHLVLVEYPEIKESSLRPSINETLAEESKRYDVAVLSEEEVDNLW